MFLKTHICFIIRNIFEYIRFLLDSKKLQFDLNFGSIEEFK
jgi:hypothetical protein